MRKLSPELTIRKVTWKASDFREMLANKTIVESFVLSDKGNFLQLDQIDLNGVSF